MALKHDNFYFTVVKKSKKNFFSIEGVYLQRVGVHVSRTEASHLSVKIGGATFSADLGGSSFYSSYINV